MIPQAAAIRIFVEVFSEYAAYLELDQPASDITHFILDVENQVRTIYPVAGDRSKLMDLLLENPNSDLNATRSALGHAFLDAGLWPVRSYFGH